VLFVWRVQLHSSELILRKAMLYNLMCETETHNQQLDSYISCISLNTRLVYKYIIFQVANWFYHFFLLN
jgi:hypothetical protein